MAARKKKSAKKKRARKPRSGGRTSRAKPAEVDLMDDFGPLNVDLDPLDFPDLETRRRALVASVSGVKSGALEPAGFGGLAQTLAQPAWLVEQIPPGPQGGRPMYRVNPTALWNLACLKATQEEIADVLGISVATFQRILERQPRLRKLMQAASSQTSVGLRHAQLDEGIEQRNPTMLRWAGIQYLGQGERATVEATAALDLSDTVKQALSLKLAEFASAKARERPDFIAEEQ